MSLIKLKNITKRFGNITAIDQLDLAIKDGEYLCILGQTGAGKTTLLRIIAGLLEPDKGEIYIDDKCVNRIPPENRNTVYMFQQFALFPHMNVWDNVSFSPTIKDWDSNRVKTISTEILEMVRLEERRDSYPHELSGGMQQRVALARGIASGARILLLDEPFGALDARLRVDLRSQLRKLVKDQGLTTIHVTHDQEEALMTADRIVVLRSGRIEQIGSPYDVYSKPQSIFVTNFVGGANFIEGNIVKVDKEESIVETRSGYQLHVSNMERNFGEKVIVAVRLEEFSIGTKKNSKANRMPGVIESSVFVGDSMEYRVNLVNDTSISVRVSLSKGFQLFEEGEKIMVSFYPERCHVFPYPKDGLLKEIEAI